MSEQKITPFESFSEVYKVLIWVGYFKFLKKPRNRCLWICHQIYRPLAFILVLWYNAVHLIFIVQGFHDHLDDVFESARIEIIQVNLVVKLITLYVYTSRIEKINKLIDEPIFAAYTKKDEEMLLQTTRNMHRLVRYIKISVSLAGVFWPGSLFAKRYQDPKAVVYIYTPFDTESWTGYSLSVLMEVAPIIWIGLGHLAIDCLVATYYAQAEVQLKIIKYNLEHLFDTDAATERAQDERFTVYRDEMDRNVRRRFVHYIQRYETVARYTKEVTDVFNYAMAFELFTSSALLCLVAFVMSFTPVVSIAFVFSMVMLVVLLMRVFVYCYVGNMVQHQSETVATSVYLSSWMSASPPLRRDLLVGMLRWSKDLTPIVFGIVPLSLTTYVSLLRSAYSLFAVLSTMNN
ncbi:odorant receptor 94a-like [Spodoptera frugiperda]|uniref:Odorant receptor n=1 Tax=Spodoptera frugiperda TaxID=7108 RepID=A0A9R0F386_SPOFR|nr:odorant receptor 94a-like [Spodoptera frugiperda]